ncbi:MAG TPA: hypothetical protein VNY05_12830 [Candidatus Acidoferrales bacterium]|nr:hypothetical protein [Candidatus Acidoferrales bacterium]
MTVSCPLDCEYLQEARKRDPMPSLEGVEVPNKDIRMTESELREHEDLLIFVAAAVLRAALKIPGVVDLDVRAALDALARTYRTLQSGIYYESRPENPLAGEICRIVQNGLEEFRRNEVKRLGSTRTRDGDVLKILVFLQHIELDRNNGRRRGRAFLDALRGFYPSPAAPSLILP